MPFTGNELHAISLLDASILTTNYRNSHPSLDTIKGFYFGRDTIEAILNQIDCVGIRIYFGEDSLSKPKLVIVGTNSNEDDITSGLIAEFGVPCPNKCGSPNPLNSWPL